MRSLIHPTYFPCIAQFHLLATTPCAMQVSDNFQKQTYRNRAYIYGANGRQLLTVPILHAGGQTGRQLFKNVRIDNTSPWQKKHWKTLETAYRTSPYFEFFEDDLLPIFHKKYDFLLDLNFDTISALAQCLGLDIQWEEVTQYQDHYADYKDFTSLTIAKESPQMSQKAYYQIFGEKHGFLPNLSCLDLLFHEGKNALSYLREQVTLG